MTNLLLSKQFERNLAKFMSSPGHALLIVGSAGTGKLSIAQNIAKVLLGLSDKTDLVNNPSLKLLSPVNNVIAIDAIRELRAFLSLKTIGSRSIKRVIVIEDANLMSGEAQNAILKVLEEPPEDTVIILTAVSDKQMPKTVVSRVQKINIVRPSLNETMAFFKKAGFSEDEITKNYLISNGSVGLMSELLTEKADSLMSKYISEAKSLIASSKLIKLKQIEEFSSDKKILANRLFAIKRVCRAALLQSIEKQDYETAKRLITSLKRISRTEKGLYQGANTKLLVANLMVDL
jgi:DNA polymerase III delta prime subunit